MEKPIMWNFVARTVSKYIFQQEENDSKNVVYESPNTPFQVKPSTMVSLVLLTHISSSNMNAF